MASYLSSHRLCPLSKHLLHKTARSLPRSRTLLTTTTGRSHYIMGIFSSKEQQQQQQQQKEEEIKPPPAEMKSKEKVVSGTQRLSKNQLKRQRKWEDAMAVKRRRKEQQRDVKIAKARAEGRDIESERRIMEENRKIGAGWQVREEKWKKKFEENSSKYEICIDCSFESVMTKKEITSLSNQIRFCYATNKKVRHPVKVTATDLKGSTMAQLDKNSGFDQWKNRAFIGTEKSLLDAFSDTEKSSLVYLTSDATDTLEELEDGKVYIIGGIVDRNRLKRAAINRAEELGIATAKLPIANYLNMVSTKVLTCNHVFEILVKYREHDNDWKKTFLSVLPNRKDASER